jgi:Putative auto-transporter adhesin, head GIN domain
MRQLLIFMLLVGLFVVGVNQFFGKGCFRAMIGPSIEGSGAVQAEVRQGLQGFDAIDISLGGDLELFIGDTYQVEVSTQANLLPYLKTEVSGGKLSVYFEGNIHTNQPVKVKVTLPALTALQLSGSTTTVLRTPLRGTELSVGVSGSANVQLPDIQVSKFSTSISGSGELTVGGSVEFSEYNVSGSGDIQALGLQSKQVEASISGSGNVHCSATDRLKARVSGSGDITYAGRPVVDADMSGSGKIHSKE